MVRQLAATVLAIALTTGVHCLDNGVAQTPPMGWMSWQYYEMDINEQIVKDVASAMASGGYLDAGYEYVCVDDGWNLPERDEEGRLTADPVKFPSGMQALSDYVHSLGLKFGMYTDVGSLTCGGEAALDMDADLTNMKQVQADMQQFADWGVDALKVDGCYQDIAIMNVTYPALSGAINSTGRPMWYSCSWPCYAGGCSGSMAAVGADRYSILSEYCNSWRDYNDVYDSTDSIYSIIDAYTQPEAVVLHNQVLGPGSINDPDMLLLGTGGLSESEEEIQAVMWALFSAPLVMSNDLPNIHAHSKELLLNREVIAINQDMAVPGSFNVTDSTDSDTYCKNLADGVIALGGIHRGSISHPTNITLAPRQSETASRLADCILPGVHDNVRSWRFRDILAQRDLGEQDTSVDCMAAQPGACLVTATPVS